MTALEYGVILAVLVIAARPAIDAAGAAIQAVEHAALAPLNNPPPCTPAPSGSFAPHLVC